VIILQVLVAALGIVAIFWFVGHAVDFLAQNSDPRMLYVIAVLLIAVVIATVIVKGMNSV